MIKVFQHHFSVGTIVELFVDALLCFVAVLLATGTIFYTSSDASIPFNQALLPAALLALLLSVLYAALGIYRRDHSSNLSSLLRRWLVAISIACIPAYMVFDLFIGGQYARHVLVYAAFYLLGGIVAIRRTGFWSRCGAFGTRRILIVGTGSEAQRIAADLKGKSDRQFEIVGFFQEGTENSVRNILNTRVFPRDRTLESIVERERVDEIIVAVKEQRGGVLPLRQLLECRIKGVPVRNLAEFYERSKGEVRLDSLKASWLIYGRGFVQDPARTFVKRLFDITVSLLLLGVSWPVMIVTALAIRIEDSGPIFFRQERVGRRGKSIMVLKFRSMRTDAEKDGVARWASKQDPRVTRVGEVIRQLRIDELPQLINVLRGEMSLVGPRPERPSFVAQLEQQIPFYGVRHSVKPGVTGWSQVRFGYGSSIEDSRRKLQFDLYYVKNHSLFLDVLVLLETVRVVLFRENAQ